MLDKILLVSKYEAKIYFTHRSPVSVWSGEGKVVELLDQVLAPLDTDCQTLSEYQHRVLVAQDDTQIIDLEELEKIS